MTVVDELVVKIGADVKGAMVGIKAVDGAVSKMEKGVGKSATNIRKATGKMVKAFAAVGAVAVVGLAVGVGKATMVFADFEQAVTNAASVTGQSGAQYEATKRNIEELSKTLGETTVFSAMQAANAMYDLASAGYDVGNMVTSDLEPIMNLAAATQNDLTFATETVTSALGQFGMGINDSLRVSDVFARAVGDSKSKMESLSIAMRTVGPTAHSMGIDIESTTAYLGTLFDAGLRGEQAATGLKGAFGKLAAPTNAAAAALADIGLTVEDVNPLTHDFTTILETLNGAGIDASDMFKIFGQEGQASMAALLANTEGVRELEAALRDCGGAAEDMATKQLDTLKGTLTLLKSAFEGLMISVGSMAAPAIKDFAVKLKDAIPHIKTLIEDGLVKLKQIIKDLTPTWENLSSIMASAKGIFTDIFIAISGGNTDTKTFTDAINSLTGALAKVFAWIDKHPGITKLAVTIGLAAVAFAYIVPIVAAVGAAIGSLLGAFATLQLIWMTTATTGAFIGGIIAAIGGPITVIIALVALLAAAWTTNFFGIRDKTKTVVDFIKKLFLGMVNFLGPLVVNWINSYIKTFNFLIPFLNKAGLNLNEIAELQFTKLENTIADTATSIEGSTGDITDAMKQVETDIEQSASGAAASYQEFSNVTATASEELTMSMVEAGVTRKDLAKRAEDVAAGIISPTAMIQAIPGQMGTEPAVRMVDEQKESNRKLEQLDKLENLSTLSEISTKLDSLKIEVNNYVTNVNKSGSSRSSSGGGSLVDSTKDASETSKNIVSYNPIITPKLSKFF